MNIKVDIKKHKKALISTAKTQDIYENFGQIEVNGLRNTYIDISSYSEEMNKKKKIIKRLQRLVYEFYKRNLSPKPRDSTPDTQVSTH